MDTGWYKHMIAAILIVFVIVLDASASTFRSFFGVYTCVKTVINVFPLIFFFQ